MLLSSDIIIITGLYASLPTPQPAVVIVWNQLVTELQNCGINYPNTRVALAATVAVESMFNPFAIASESDIYRGRGLIQLTGEANYVKYGQKLNVNLKDSPQLALDLETGAKIAAVYFKDHGLDIHANRGDWRRIRLAVNGGLNGFDKFLNYIWPMLEAEYGS
jgi:hypothetical protein